MCVHEAPNALRPHRGAHSRLFGWRRRYLAFCSLRDVAIASPRVGSLTDFRQAAFLNLGYRSRCQGCRGGLDGHSLCTHKPAALHIEGPKDGSAMEQRNGRGCRPSSIVALDRGSACPNRGCPREAGPLAEHPILFIGLESAEPTNLERSTTDRCLGSRRCVHAARGVERRRLVGSTTGWSEGGEFSATASKSAMLQDWMIASRGGGHDALTLTSYSVSGALSADVGHCVRGP